MNFTHSCIACNQSWLYNIQIRRQKHFLPYCDHTLNKLVPENGKGELVHKCGTESNWLVSNIYAGRIKTLHSVWSHIFILVWTWGWEHDHPLTT